jgi:phage/plasmid-associated DNA primase
MVARIETVLGRFNKHMEGKLLTVLNEISNYGGAHKSNDYLKSLITDETLTIEPKGKETYTIRDCSRFVFLTNNNWAVKVESRDRRYVVIEADQEHVGNHEYFTRLAAALEHPDAPTSMFSYLATLDLSQWNHRLLPQTQARDEVQLASVPTPIRYIISQLEHHKTMAYFEDYKQWCETHNERNEFNSRSFFHLLRNALGQEIKSRRIDTGVAKVMCLDNTEAALQALRAHLNQPNLVLSPVEENPDYDELKDYMME